ncbi:hypothetical protein SAMN05519104_8120 [Rhizobiales bacterium GAS188]|nr:hypothetical protein SAMN05519104_8120 [Rhizobiales bacterium GAS188]
MTYYAVLPFRRGEEGELVALEAIEARDGSQACRSAVLSAKALFVASLWAGL